MIARDDIRETNNLPVMGEPQEQGTYTMLNEARELVAVAGEISALDNTGRIRKHLLDIQDFVFRHRSTSPSAVVEVTGKEIEDLKWAVGRALEMT